MLLNHATAMLSRSYQMIRAVLRNFYSQECILVNMTYANQEKIFLCKKHNQKHIEVGPMNQKWLKLKS